MGNPNLTQLEKRVKQPISRLHWQHMFALDDPLLQLASFAHEERKTLLVVVVVFLFGLVSGG
jgi:hypothetical protein